MAGKGAKVLAVSAQQYRLYMKGDTCSEIPPESTGIPELRRFLLQLPARANYRTLHNHVFETLPDIATQMRRIFEKFDEDVVYAGMRKDLKERLPHLRQVLEDLCLDSPRVLVFRPWDIDQQKLILSGLLKFAMRLRHGLVWYASFVKMLKENGIPINGKMVGRNLNQEILRSMFGYIKTWHIAMSTCTEGLSARLNEPVQDLLGCLKVHLGISKIEPELRRRANDALDTTKRRIDMATVDLKTKLDMKLRENFLLFTTEVNVKCPIAVAMKPIYHSALAKVGGQGAYRRARKQLIRRLTVSNKIHRNLPDIMANQIMNALKTSWEQCCREYATEAMTLLEGFQQITDDLLDSQGFIKAENRTLRDQLRPLLPGFESSLALLKKEFPNIEHTPGSGKRKRTEVEDTGASGAGS